MVMCAPALLFSLVLFPYHPVFPLLSTLGFPRTSFFPDMCGNTGNTFVILTMKPSLVVLAFNNVLEFETSYVAFLPADRTTIQSCD